MFKVLASDKVSKQGLDLLAKAGFQADLKTGLSEDELVSIIGDYDGLVIRSETKVTARVIEAAKKLKIVGRAGVGVDNVDLAAATKRGIIVVNSPEGNTVAAAEQTLAMILAMVRSIPQAHASMKKGEWERSRFKGIEVLGKTLGVIGLGKIGGRVASYGVAMGMKVIGSDPFATKEYAEKLGVELLDLSRIISEADIITLHVPKTKETMGMINKELIAKMKDGVRIVNVARGGLINENDLAEAIKSGKVAGAAIDVWEKEPPENKALIELDQVVCCPHLGASTVEAQVNVAIDVIEQIIDVLNGRTARSAVNIPSMRPEIVKPVQPYLGLAEKMGRLASQLVEGAIRKIRISYVGEVAEKDVSPLTTAVLKGIFDAILPESVNFVNAPLIAKERAVEVVESKNTEVGDFANLISVRLTTDKGEKEVGGSMFGSIGDRLVSIDGLKVDAVPSGYLLILSNIDQPGVIGLVGTLLGKHNINIAGMDVGRVKIGEKAVMVINVDSEVPAKTLAELEKVESIHAAKLVKV
ncbi:MAG: phosphoglycerate dehydrogenase [Candidatus Saganbacteria bacterium]|nr:phosphoglycerate dehydrogenase [Candidatus Saganbacteria bacterium]